MKKIVLDRLKSFGFRPRKLKKAFVKRYLVPRGYGEWQSLILDEQDFKDAVSGAVDQLLGLERATDLGNYLEFGVSRGTSMACVYDVLQAKGLGHVPLVGFELVPRAAPGGRRRGLGAGRLCLDCGGDAAVSARPRRGPRSGHPGQGMVSRQPE